MTACMTAMTAYLPRLRVVPEEDRHGDQERGRHGQHAHQQRAHAGTCQQLIITFSGSQTFQNRMLKQTFDCFSSIQNPFEIILSWLPVRLTIISPASISES